MAGALIGALIAPAGAVASGVAPTAVTDIVATPANTPVSGNLLANDTDPESDALAITSAHLVSPAYGTLVVAADGAFTYTPAADWSGSVSHGGYYWMNDGTSASVRGWIDLVVNFLPEATPQSVTTDEDTPIDITLAGTDEDGTVASFAIAAAPAHGDLTGTGASRTYTPDADWNGADSFTFTVTDNVGGVSPAATVNVTVDSVADLPTADGQTVDVEFETATDITLTGEDGDGDLLDFQVLTNPTHGVLTGTAPDLTYTPADAYQGADSFTFKVVAGGNDSNIATVTIDVADTVAPTVPTPTLAFGSGRVNESAPLLISWSATDAGTGVAGYVVEAKVGAGAWTQIYAGTDRSITRFYAFNTDLRWRVKAKDVSDNWSAYSETAVRRVLVYQGTSPVATTGTWSRVNSSGSSGTNYYYTTSSGKYKQLTFSGIAVAFVAPESSSGAKVTVKIDTSSYATNTWKTGAMSLGTIIKSKSLTSGSHTIRVTSTQGGKRAYFDAFVVLR